MKRDENLKGLLLALCLVALSFSALFGALHGSKVSPRQAAQAAPALPKQDIFDSISTNEIAPKLKGAWAESLVYFSKDSDGTFTYQDPKTLKIYRLSNGSLYEEKTLSDADVGFSQKPSIADEMAQAKLWLSLHKTPEQRIADEMSRANDIAEDRLFWEKLNTPSAPLHTVSATTIEITPNPMDSFYQQQNSDDLHKIRQIYEQQDLDRKYGPH